MTTTVEGLGIWADAAQALVDETGCEIIKWRSNLTGISFNDRREIEVPRPKTAKSFAIFAHEIGHQQLHYENSQNYPRWMEEAEAWDFALDQFTRFGLKGRNKIKAWAFRFVIYSFNKARRRGVNAALILRAFPQWDWRR